MTEGRSVLAMDHTSRSILLQIAARNQPVVGSGSGQVQLRLKLLCELPPFLAEAAADIMVVVAVALFLLQVLSFPLQCHCSLLLLLAAAAVAVFVVHVLHDRCTSAALSSATHCCLYIRRLL